MTRWQIGGDSGGVDTDTPPQPVFGLNLAGQGTIELVGIGFTDLTNTHTIMAGTLSLFSWNELSSPTTFTLASGDRRHGYDDYAERRGTGGGGGSDPD